MTGRFSNTVDFDPGPGTFNLTALGRTDGFIVKYTPDQQFVWAHRFGGADSESTQRVQFDAAGNVYLIGGSSSSSIDFGPDITLTNQGGGDAFAVKLDSDGIFQWAHSWGSTGSDSTMSLAVDDAGNVHIVGWFSNTVDFDPGSEVGEVFELTSQENTDGYLLQLDTLGSFVSAMSIGGSEEDRLQNVNIDGAGIVYASGTFNGTAQVETSDGSIPVVLTSAGIDDHFLMKIDANGNTEWIRQVTGDGGGGVGFDGSGGIYFSGNFSGTINFGSGTPELTSAGGKDVFITKWDTDGTLVWSGQISGPEDINASRISFDLQGNPHFAGLFHGTTDFDPGPGTVQRTGSFAASYVLKLDTDGNFQWVKLVEGSTFARRPTSVDDAGNVYLAGNFDLRYGTATFPTGEVLTSVGISDIYVLKLDNLGLDNTTTTYNSTDVNKALKDRKGKNNGKTNSTLTIPDSFEILDLNLQLDISHTRDEDLDVYLLGPDDTIIELFTDEGNGGGNFFDGIILDAEASTSITSGIVGTRRYEPEGDLGQFNTIISNSGTAGTWTLQIEDDSRGEVGTLNSWSITFTHPTPGPNDPPTANDDLATTNEDTAVVIHVLANDTDPNPTDTLSVTSVQDTSDFGASVSVAPDGSVTYDPSGSATLQALTNGQSLIDTFSYTIGDGNGGSSSAIVTVTVNGLNDAPVAIGDSYSTQQDTILTIAAPGVLFNDSDAEGELLTVNLVAGPGNAAAFNLFADGSFSYTPNPGFTGTDTFTYEAGDGTALSNTATVTIDVTAQVTTNIYSSSDTPLSIPDQGSVSLTIIVEDEYAIDDLTVQIDIGHQRPSDLTIILTSPSGTQIELSPTGGSGTAFIDENVNGNWTLDVIDGRKKKTGTLNSWSLTITEKPPGVTVTNTTGLVTTESGGTATFSVVLDSPPTGTVSVHLVPSDTSEGILEQANSDDQTLEFDETNWEIAQDVTVIGVDDIFDDGDALYMILIDIFFSDDPDYLDIDPDDVEITNMDDEAPLHVAGGGADSGSVATTSLTQATLQAVFDQAVGLWQAADPSRTALLNTVNVSITDYSGSLLGTASSTDTIWIDRDAAGFGWSTNAWAVNPGQIDLLSVVSHELGHLIGLDHDEMGATLALGSRYLVSSGLATETSRSESPLSGFSFYEGTRASSLTDNSDSEQIYAEILGSVPVVPRFSLGRKKEDESTDSVGNTSDIILADDKSADDLFAEFNESLLDDLLAV